MVRRRTLMVAAALTGAFGISETVAHDWYPLWCCSDKDCRELSEDRGEVVTEDQDGWHLWDGRVAARNSARPSPNAKFHLCEEQSTKAIICFFAPPGGS